MIAPANRDIEELLTGLNPPQREAVTHTDGPMLVLAGAGSGKTRVITRRAAYLAFTVARPSEVLAITFTNKAANEMRERIAVLGIGREMTVCTFHSLCVRLLRAFHERAGLPPHFSIYDTEDQRKVVKEAIESLSLASSNWTPAAMHAAISRAKNHMQSAAEFADRATDWHDRTVARIYQAYERRMGELEALDFDDLLLKTARLLQYDQELRSRLEDRYRYLLIDEYQDTNEAQYVISNLLTRVRQNICATGDPDQSIYGWRGANIRNILHFEEDYPSAKVVRLEQNYRSTPSILAAADRVIAENVHRKEKTLWTENEDGPRVRVVECGNTVEEAGWLAGQIQQAIADGAAPGDIAVFFRINAMSRAVEEALLRGGIAYQVARGTEYYNRKEIKDVLAYLRLLVNPADEISLLRIINTPPRGIGDTTLSRLRNYAAVERIPLLEAVHNAASAPGIGRSLPAVQDFCTLLARLRELLAEPPSMIVRETLRHSGILALLTQEADANRDPLDNVNELINAAADFESQNPGATLLDWLQFTSLIGDVDSLADAGGAVTLMTLHACKGLEFPIVYLLGLEEGLLPFTRNEEPLGEDAEEEERRLCFVGMTRARRELTLTFARYRMIRGIETRTARSRFLRPLRDEVDWIQASPERQRGRSGWSAPRGRLPDDIAEWQVGSLVRHPKHGLGQITVLRRAARHTLVSVAFQSGDEQSMILEFADLTRVDYDEVG